MFSIKVCYKDVDNKTSSAQQTILQYNKEPVTSYHSANAVQRQV